MFDWVQVWRIGWQEQEPCTDVVQGFSGTVTFMGGEIIEDNDIASAQRWGELCLDIGLKGDLGHGGVEDPWCGEAAAAQSRDKGLRAPMTERRMHDKALAFGRAASKPGHLGCGRRFINKNQPMWGEPHERLSPDDPVMTRAAHISALLFPCPQRFFYSGIPP